MCRTADDVEDAIRAGKIASLFGLEGYVHLLQVHELATDILVLIHSETLWEVSFDTAVPKLMTVLRMFHQLGVRYMTLTHGCNNAFADSGGIFELPEPKWNGLSYVHAFLAESLLTS